MRHHIAVCTHQKTGTVWMNAVFKDLATRLGVEYRNISRLSPEEKAQRVTKTLGRDASPAIFFDNHAGMPDAAKGREFRGVHLVRDPRDMIISAARYHTTTDATFANTPKKRFNDLSLKDALLALPTLEERLAFEIEHVVAPNLEAMVAFDGRGRYATLHYEELIADRRMTLAIRLFTFLGLDERETVEALRAHWAHSLFGAGSNTRPDHVKDGSARQFERIYTPALVAAFEAKFGHIVDTLGYRGVADRSSGTALLDSVELPPRIRELSTRLISAADDAVESVLDEFAGEAAASVPDAGLESSAVAHRSAPDPAEKRARPGGIGGWLAKTFGIARREPVDERRPTQKAPASDPGRTSDSASRRTASAEKSKAVKRASTVTAAAISAVPEGTSPLASLVPTSTETLDSNRRLAPSGRRAFLVTVDVEALPARSDEDHVERLIWGRFDNGEEAGMGRMLGMASAAGVPVTCYLDYAETQLYGDAIHDVGRSIHESGHDLQLHMHPELWPRDYWAALGLDRPRSMQEAYDVPRSRAVLEHGLAMLSEVKPRDQLVSYRAGSFRIGPSTLEAMRDLNLTVSSNLSHRTYCNHRRVPPVPPEQRLFRWDNGVWELPVDQYRAGEEWRVLTLPLKARSEQEMDALLAPIADVADRRPVCFILHSWSLLQKKPDTKLMIGPSDRLIEQYGWLLNIAARRFEPIDVTTLSRRLDAVGSA